MNTKEILKNIKTTRLVKEISQSDMASQLGISVPTYSRFENGVTKINFILLQKVSKLLDIDNYQITNESNLIENFIDLKVKDSKQLSTSDKLKLVIELLKKQEEVNSLLINILKEIKTEDLV